MVCSPCHHLELLPLLVKLNPSTDAPVPGTNASTSSADSCAHEAFDLTLGPGKSFLHGLALHVAHCHFGHERSSPRQYPRTTSSPSTTWRPAAHRRVNVRVRMTCTPVWSRAQTRHCCWVIDGHGRSRMRFQRPSSQSLGQIHWSC